MTKILLLANFIALLVCHFSSVEAIAYTDGTNESGSIHAQINFPVITDSLDHAVLPEADQVTIHPQPASNYLTITTGLPMKSIEIFNTLGKSVVVANKLSRHQHTVDIRSIDNGIYVIQIKLSDGNTLTRRLTIG